jgi:hypothetical protein
VRAQPLFDHGYSIDRSEASDFGVHLQHASMTRGNTEYPKYDPPGVQNSCDVLAKGIICTLLPLSQNASCK